MLVLSVFLEITPNFPLKNGNLTDLECEGKKMMTNVLLLGELFLLCAKVDQIVPHSYFKT